MAIISRAELLLQAKNYAGSGNWLDESGNGHDAVPNGGVTFLPYKGTQYLWLPGSAGNYASTPDSAALSITGDIDLQARVALDDWTPASTQNLVSKWTVTGDQRSYTLQVISTGALRLVDSATGAVVRNLYASTVAPTVSDGDWLWVRAKRNATTGDVTFYTGGSGIVPSWTQLGAVVSGISGSINDSTAVLELGSINEGTSEIFAGKISHARIYSDLTETNLVFDADFADVNALTEPFSSFTENTGKTVTINRSSSGYVSTVVDRSQWVLDGVNDYLEVADHPNLNFGTADDFTLMAVFRYHATQAATAAIVAKTAGFGITAGYVLFTDVTGPDRSGLNIADGSVESFDRLSVTPLGRRRVVAGVRDTVADNIEAFLDGTGSGSPGTDATTTSLATSNTLRLGRLSGTGTNYYRGALIAVALWREALSDADVAAAGDELTQIHANELMLMGVG